MCNTHIISYIHIYTYTHTHNILSRRPSRSGLGSLPLTRVATPLVRIAMRGLYKKLVQKDGHCFCLIVFYDDVAHSLSGASSLCLIS